MRHGIKALGLSLLTALCLTAVMASGAQALLVNGGEFLTSEGTFKELEISSETITGGEVVPGTNEFLILELELTLKCEDISVANGTIKALGHGQGTVDFEGCQFFDLEGGSAGCVPFDIKANALALVFLHGNTTGKTHHPYILYEPAGGGTVFASVVPEECLVPAADIEGSVVAEVLSNPLGHQEELIEAVTPGTLKLFPEHKLSYGENECHPKWEKWARLTGPSQGESWGIS